MPDAARRPRPRRTRVALAASVAALLAAGLVPAPSLAAPTDDSLPILGQALTRADRDGRAELLITVHGVRRVEGGTAVYWSAGAPEGAEGKIEIAEHLGSGANMSVLRIDSEFLGDVAALDLDGKSAYTTMYTGESMYDCLCRPRVDLMPNEPTPGTAYVGFAVLPPLPEGLTTVDLKVAGQVFAGIPVEEGPLEPVAEQADEPIVVGTGWPQIPSEEVAKVAEPERFVVPLSTHVKVPDTAVSTRETTDSRNVDLSADVLFAVDKATLTPRAKKEIQAAADRVEAAEPTGTITVIGHTDSDGSDSHNQDLSERRAKAVADALKPLLPSGLQITTEGKGETEPIADNETDEGKALNRRVTITIPGGTS